MTLDFGADNNFVLTLAAAPTLVNPSTEDVGSQASSYLFRPAQVAVQSLGTDYETGGNGITLSTAASATDCAVHCCGI